MQLAEVKERQWTEFATRVRLLLKKGLRGLRRLPPQELSELITGYQAISGDLARARALRAPVSTVEYLNGICVSAHNLLYGCGRPANSEKPRRSDWTVAFARGVRGAPGAVVLATLAMFVPALISYLAVVLHPALAFDIVPGEFYHFQPSSAEHMHEIPSLMRPLVASSIISNNIQVTFLAFALGITFGLGTTAVLVFNGVHLGAVAGWMTHNGQLDALVGWILPHGSTELLAITLAGAAGYLLADALWAPGLRPRLDALQRAAQKALVIELGCMFMLFVAGLIEGNVSPSSLGFTGRVIILAFSLLLWAAYFGLAGREYSQVKPAALE